VLLEDEALPLLLREGILPFRLDLLEEGFWAVGGHQEDTEHVLLVDGHSEILEVVVAGSTLLDGDGVQLAELDESLS
jgi:hypothetical protein